MSQVGNEKDPNESEAGSLTVPNNPSLAPLSLNAAQPQAAGEGKQKRNIDEIVDADSASKPPNKKVAVEGARGIVPKSAAKDTATNPKVPYKSLEDASQLPAWASGSHDIKKILRLPKVRELDLRSGANLDDVENRCTKTADLAATLGQMRGSEPEKSCEQCIIGRGRFAKCLVLENHFLGACTNCKFGQRGEKCSFRTRLKQEKDSSQALAD